MALFLNIPGEREYVTTKRETLDKSKIALLSYKIPSARRRAYGGSGQGKVGTKVDVDWEANS